MKFFYFLILVFLMFSFEGGAHATSCKTEPVPVEDRVKNADVIFVGKFRNHMKRVDERKSPFGASKATILTVKQVFKGEVGKEVTIFYRPEQPGCSFDHFRAFSFKGDKVDLLIFAKVENGKLYTSQKMGSGYAEAHSSDITFLTKKK